MSFDYFDAKEFSRSWGKLTRSVATKDFVPLGTHKAIRDEIEQQFMYQFTVRLLVAPIGHGKTWTLSWLWEYFEKPKTLVIGHASWSLQTSPPQSLLQGILAALEQDKEKPLKRLLDAKPATKYGKWLSNLLQDGTAASILYGESGGRLPPVEGVPRLSLNNDKHLRFLFSGLIDLCTQAGFERVLILADEVEAVVLGTGKRQRLLFADFLRQLLDDFQDAKDMCHVQMVLAGTTGVLERWTQQVQTTSSGDQTTEAFLRRLSTPLFIKPPSDSEIERIVRVRIENHSDKNPMLPFEDNVIPQAWKASMHSLGECFGLLRGAHDVAIREGAKRVTIKHLEEARKRIFSSGNAPAE